jgi:hypothetical protein
MKNTTYSKKLAYIGTGCGIILFAVFGLLPGFYIGGVMGISLAGNILGHPVASAILPRIIVSLSIGIGVMVAGIMFITVSATAGWLIGAVIDTLRAEEKDLAALEQK